MKQTFFLSVLILTLGLIQSCSTSQKIEAETETDAEYVAAIQNTPVTKEELKRGYTGSTDPDSVSIDELRDFLPSYVDYRLKILEGRRMGFFEDPDIQNEYRTYAKEIAQKKWLDGEIKSRILDSFIQRSQKELLAYHILITAENPGYEESREKKNQLLAAKKEIEDGADPDSVNIKYSSVQNENYAGGPLPWITAGRTVQSFEDALYALEPGEVSRPFQTEFGFHIIYLLDERPRTPERFVKHIFVSNQGNENPGQKITEALDSLRNGVTWNEVVERFSDDTGTSARGGQVGWVGYGMQFPEPFVDEVMKSSINADYSNVIEMDYGFHIVTIDSVRNLSSEKAMKEYAYTELERTGRLQPDKEELYESLKKDGNYQIFDEEFEKTADYLLGNTDNIDEEAHIAEFNGKKVLAGQFIDYFEQEQRTNSEEKESLNNAFEQFINRLIDKDIIELTKERFDEYRFEMEQFLNGLVVFKVNEEFLWNPDAADEQMLRDYFEKNRSDFVKNETLTYHRITATSDSVISSARERLLQNNNPENLNNQFESINVTSSSLANNNSELFQKLNLLDEGEATKIENNETWFQFFYVTKIEPQRRMTFQEAKNEVFNALRDRHENDYLRSLREKYETEFYPENVQ